MEFNIIFQERADDEKNVPKRYIVYKVMIIIILQLSGILQNLYSCHCNYNLQTITFCTYFIHVLTINLVARSGTHKLGSPVKPK